jgi:MFS transporter, FSR family, fosmidomycin resistance protein
VQRATSNATTSPQSHDGDARTLARERLSIGLISTAHGVSHFYMLILVPLFPLFKSQWGISFVQLGFVLMVWNVAGVIAQTPAGILVDRIGSRKLLVGALLIGAAAFATAGVLSSYWGLVLAAAVAGLVNAVYHPADYDLLHHTVGNSRVGRAFSIHSFMGFVGYGLAPAFMLGLNAAFGLKIALIAGALVGLIPAIPLMFAGFLDHRPAADSAKASEERIPLRRLLTPAIVSLTVFFMLMQLSGIQSFMIPALHELDGIPLTLASIALTCYLAGNGLGVLAGGVLADRTSRHEAVAFVGFLAMAAILLAIGAITMGGYAVCALLIVAGVCGGLIMPSRDMLVRKNAPPGAMGRTFGVVTTGFNIGGTIGPLMYGFMLDRGQPRLIFIAAVAFFVLTAFAPMLIEGRRKRANPAPLPSAARLGSA